MNDGPSNSQNDNPTLSSNTQQPESCGRCGQKPCVCPVQDIDTSSHNQSKPANGTASVEDGQSGASVGTQGEKKPPKIRWM